MAIDTVGTEQHLFHRGNMLEAGVKVNGVVGELSDSGQYGSAHENRVTHFAMKRHYGFGPTCIIKTEFAGVLGKFDIAFADSVT
jgi:hypothetical protein